MGSEDVNDGTTGNTYLVLMTFLIVVIIVIIKKATRGNEPNEDEGRVFDHFVLSRPLREHIPCFSCKRHKENMRSCNKCNIAVYCCNKCRKNHWPKHKTACRTSARLPSPGGRMDEYGNKSTDLRPCLSCNKLKSQLIKCSKCHVAEYCDRVCEANHRREHRPGCDNFPKFHKALANSSSAMAKVHGCQSTGMVFPPFPHHASATIQQRSGSSLLLEIVGPHHHFLLRHGVYVQDVNGNEVHMLFYHEKSEELSLQGSLNRLLEKGNFIRWFYPRWRFFLDGTVGFRIDSLKEIEFIQKSWEFDFSNF